MFPAYFRWKKLFIYLAFGSFVATVLRHLVLESQNGNHSRFFYVSGRRHSRSRLPLHLSPNNTLASASQTERLQLWPWQLSNAVHCDGNLVMYGNNFARLRHVILDPAYLEGPAGGEDVQSVINRPEAQEYSTLKPGFFKLRCSSLDSIAKLPFRGDNHLNRYYAALVTNRFDASASVQLQRVTRTTLAVTRYEYVNNCHSMTYFYNAYLTMRYFNLSAADIDVLLIDAHPTAPTFDNVWSTLFGNYSRVSALRSRGATEYNDLVWMLMGYHAPIIQDRFASAPLIEEFRDFFLRQHDVRDDRQLDCSKIRVTFIWRRNYVAHPRNPTGLVSRRITNEEELIDRIEKEFGNRVNVVGIQLEKLPMSEQLQIVAQSDLLIGMHGAGLMHVLFLPKHASLIELFPTYWSTSNMHFRKIAEWRELHYFSWVNRDYRLEVAKQSTYIPPNVLIQLVRTALNNMRCLGRRLF